MPIYFINITNSQYRADDEGENYVRPEDALAFGVRGALALLTDEINAGESHAAADVSIRDAEGLQVLRSVVAMSVSALHSA